MGAAPGCAEGAGAAVALGAASGSTVWVADFSRAAVRSRLGSRSAAAFRSSSPGTSSPRRTASVRRMTSLIGPPPEAKLRGIGANCDAYLLESASLGSPGIESLRWLAPVYPGDTLRVRFTVLESRAMSSRPDVGLIRSLSEVLNQHGEVVQSGRLTLLVAKRPAA